MKKSSLRRVPGLLAACSIAVALGAPVLTGCAKNGAARDSASYRVLSADEVQRNVESFDVVWETIRDKHFDPEYNGVDWNAVKDQYRPAVERATTMAAARGAMDDAIGTMRLSHFGIIPSEAYSQVNPDADSDAPSTDHSGTSGMIVRIVGDEAWVTQLRASGPAEQARIRTGYKLLAIGDEDVTRYIRKVRQADASNHFLGIALQRGLEARLSGPVGSEVKLTLLDELNRRIAVTLTRAKPEGAPATFGNLPTMHVTFDSGMVENTNIGYIGLNLFFDPAGVMPRLEESINSMRATDGIILDLRGNPGGIGAMAMGFSGWFIDAEDQKLGTMTTRESQLDFVINPQPEPFTGPLAILVDELTGSTAEILAGGLQDLGRARVFGQRSPGAALPSQIAKLPNGDGFQFAFANYVSTGGQPLEGRGVIPDQAVPLDRATLLRNQDPVINAAVAWIQGVKR